MRIYKFKDNIDGKYAFIIAKDEALARQRLNEETSLEYFLVDTKSLEEYNKPILFFNTILPF